MVPFGTKLVILGEPVLRFVWEKYTPLIHFLICSCVLYDQCRVDYISHVTYRNQILLYFSCSNNDNRAHGKQLPICNRRCAYLRNFTTSASESAN